MEPPDVTETAPETFEEFKNSFSYGSRSNLNFKFLKALPPEEAGEFFHQLVDEISSSYDHGDVSPIHHLVNQWQVRAYTPHSDAKRTYVYDDAPFTPLSKPLGESSLGLMTSSGHFVTGDDPQPLGVENMDQRQAEKRISEFLRATPVLSEIPVDTPPENLEVRHGGYPVASIAADRKRGVSSG